MNASYAAVVYLALECLSDEEIAALNNGLTGFGHITTTNLAFPAAVAAGLIAESGRPTFDLEDTRAALDLQIRTRPGFAPYLAEKLPISAT